MLQYQNQVNGGVEDYGCERGAVLHLVWLTSRDIACMGHL